MSTYHQQRHPFCKLLPLLLFILLQSAPRVAHALTLTDRQIADVEQGVRAEMERQQIVGMAIGIIGEGEIVYLNGFGWADAERKIPVGPNTMFRWASLTKQLTATVAMQLVEKHRLDLAKDVRQYVPDFPDKGVVITIRDLLCHQSGLQRSYEGPLKHEKNYDIEHPFEDVANAINLFKDKPLIFSPCEKYEYSNAGYLLLAAAIQNAGRQKFNDQVMERIARPLGMKTLQPDYQWIDIPERAVGYTKKDGVLVPSTNTDVSYKLGAGGYISNIEDLARYARGMIHASLLKPESYGAMWQEQLTAGGEPTGYGFGIHIENLPNGRVKLYHTGKQEKSGSRLVVFPREGHGIVLLSNCDHIETGKFGTAIYNALNRT